MKTLQFCTNPLVAPPYCHSTIPKNQNFINYTSLTSNNSCLIPRRRFWVPPLSANSRQSSEPIVVSSKPGVNKEKKLELEGVITESLPNGMFYVRLANNEVVLGYISGKIRKNFIKILPGDKVIMEVSLYDTTRGRIIFRQDSNTKGRRKNKKQEKEEKKKGAKGSQKPLSQRILNPSPIK